MYIRKMDNQANNSPIRYLALGIFAIAATFMTFSVYFVMKSFIQDREELLFRDDLPLRQTPDTPVNRNETKTYTAEELEELRKQGKSPVGYQPPTQHQAIQANEAAVQRSLKTLEEINRINQMNQQLMEQQQRMNRQQR